MKTTLNCPKDYDLLSSVHAWIFPDIQPVPEQTSSGCLKREFTIDEKSVPLSIVQKSIGERIEISWTDDHISGQKIISKITRILNLKLDMDPVLNTIAEDEYIGFISPSVRGIRPYLANTMFEAVIKTILQQQISYRAANVITKRLVFALHDPTRKLYSFPDAEKILNLGEEGLKKLGAGYKTDYILGVCDLAKSRMLDFEGLRELSFEDIIRVLNPIKGIGRWTLEVLAIAGMGDFSIYPYGDLGIQNLLGRIYNDGKRMKRKEVERTAERWGEHGAMVLYLLMCADVLGLMNEMGRSQNR